VLLENKYKKIYFKIINKALSETRSKQDFYYEKHHIIPKSLNGTNDVENLVLLTAREHYLCHKLLTKFTVGIDKKKMFCAMWAFNRKSKNQKRVVLNSRDYEYVRLFLAKSFSEDRKGKHLVGHRLSEEHKQKLSKSLLGRKRSENTKKKMIESWKFRPPRSKEHCLAISNANKGRIVSDETKQKMSNSKKGKNPIHTQVKWHCEYCNKEGIGISNYNRWHGNNCKEKNNV